jgi:hypothetical protein
MRSTVSSCVLARTSNTPAEVITSQFGVARGGLPVRQRQRAAHAVAEPGARHVRDNHRRARGQRAAKLRGDTAFIRHVDFGGQRDDDRRGLSRGHRLTVSQRDHPPGEIQREPPADRGGGPAGGPTVETNEPLPGYGTIMPGFAPPREAQAAGASHPQTLARTRLEAAGGAGCGGQAGAIHRPCRADAPLMHLAAHRADGCLFDITTCNNALFSVPGADARRRLPVNGQRGLRRPTGPSTPTAPAPSENGP